MPGTAKVAEVITWLRNDGSRCLKMIFNSLVPDRRAATTKSSSRSDRKRPRTTRANPVQPISERMRVTPK